MVYRLLFVRDLALTPGYSALSFTQTLVKRKSDCRLHPLAQTSTLKVIEIPEGGHFPPILELCSQLNYNNMKHGSHGPGILLEKLLGS